KITRAANWLPECWGYRPLLTILSDISTKNDLGWVSLPTEEFERLTTELVSLKESNSALLKEVIETLPTVMAQHDNLRDAFQEVHYGINDYLQEYGEYDGKLTQILIGIDQALGHHKK